VKRYLDPDHHCAWREELSERVSELEGIVQDLRGQLAALQRYVFGKKSERVPPISREVRREKGPDPEAAKKKRAENAEKKKQLPQTTIPHSVPESERCCPTCGGHDLRALGEGKVSFVVEYEPPKLLLQRHVQETLSCRCGEGIVTAEGPPKVVEKGGYGPGFIAHLITAKCADHLPIYRLEKGFARLGLHMARSTMTDLFHAAAVVLRPLYEKAFELIARSELVQADETPLKVQERGEARKAYVWTFLNDVLVGFRFSPSRSGETPSAVLGASEGTLVVDAYTGYNPVCTPKGRKRAGCLAHARRYFYEALATAPEAQKAITLIREVYLVEHEATALGVVRSAAHLRMRQERSAASMEKLRVWLIGEKPKHTPKSPMGEAIRYAQRNWKALTQFLSDAQVPVDNNASERALRRVALGRKNYLFVGNDVAGENLAVLYTLVASCEANGVNPEEYLREVLLKVPDHPHNRIEELLPHRWKKPPEEVKAAA
jgi:transposase